MTVTGPSIATPWWLRATPVAEPSTIVLPPVGVADADTEVIDDHVLDQLLGGPPDGSGNGSDDGAGGWSPSGRGGNGPERGLDGDEPRDISPALPLSDRLFRGGSRTLGITVLVIMGSIGLFLAQSSIPTFHHYGLSFLTRAEWNPDADKVGIAAVLVGTVTVAVIAMSIAFPLALASALFISEYAPARLRATLVSVVDLMAAIPSIIYGLWGSLLIMKYWAEIARFLQQNFGFIPIFKVDTDPNASGWDYYRYHYEVSAFAAAIPVAMMVLPMACAVMREVFSQTPPGEKEAALALGATRWGMIRSVVIPFGRGGIIGGSMLALGRALGETIAVYLIISPEYKIKVHPLEHGTSTISALIAGRFGESTPQQLKALLTAGFVLFLITLFVNTVAATIVNRGRNSANGDI